MKVRAKIGFAGPSLSMAAGTAAEINDEAVLQDLLRAGFVEPAEPVVQAEEAKPAQKKTTKKRSRS